MRNIPCQDENLYMRCKKTGLRLSDISRVTGRPIGSIWPILKGYMPWRVEDRDRLVAFLDRIDRQAAILAEIERDENGGGDVGT